MSGIGSLVALCACFPGCSRQGSQVRCEDIILRASLIRQVVFHGRWRSVLSALMCTDVNVAIAISSDLFDVK